MQEIVAQQRGATAEERAMDALVDSLEKRSRFLFSVETDGGVWVAEEIVTRILIRDLVCLLYPRTLNLPRSLTLSSLGLCPLSAHQQTCFRNDVGPLPTEKVSWLA